MSIITQRVPYNAMVSVKFIQWNVPPLESLCNSNVYLLRMKLYRGKCMSRKDELLRAWLEKKN